MTTSGGSSDHADDDLLPEEIELLHAIASGHATFHARPRDSEPMWLRTLNRLAVLRDLGLVRFRSSTASDGMPLLVGPCELTPAGREVLQRHPSPTSEPR